MFDDWCLYKYLHRWIQIKWHGWLNANTTFRLLRLCHCINDGALLLSAQWHTFILATAAASYHNHSKCIFTNNYACLHKWAKKKERFSKKKNMERRKQNQLLTCDRVRWPAKQSKRGRILILAEYLYKFSLIYCCSRPPSHKNKNTWNLRWSTEDISYDISK